MTICFTYRNHTDRGDYASQADRPSRLGLLCDCRPYSHRQNVRGGHVEGNEHQEGGYPATALILVLFVEVAGMFVQGERRGARVFVVIGQTVLMGHCLTSLCQYLVVLLVFGLLRENSVLPIIGVVAASLEK